MTAKVAGNLYGNLDLLVLRALELEGPLHGLGVMDVLRTLSRGKIDVEGGALYRALHRLEERGLLTAEWRISDANRRAKFYTLASAGRKELARAREEWVRHAETMGQVLGLDGEGGR